MATSTIRELLHRQIDVLPDDMIQQIADFTLFVAARRKLGRNYSDWNAEQWEEFAVEQFFRETEDDDVVYTLHDAKEDVSDFDFDDSGLKTTSYVRLARLMSVAPSVVNARLGSITPERLRRIRDRLAEWLHMPSPTE